MPQAPGFRAPHEADPSTSIQALRRCPPAALSLSPWLAVPPVNCLRSNFLPPSGHFLDGITRGAACGQCVQATYAQFVRGCCFARAARALAKPVLEKIGPPWPIMDRTDLDSEVQTQLGQDLTGRP